MCYVKEDNLHELFLTYTDDRDTSGTFPQTMMLDSNANGPLMFTIAARLVFKLSCKLSTCYAGE